MNFVVFVSRFVYLFRQVKQRRAAKLVEIIDGCKLHGGPLKHENITLLDGMNDEQVKKEIQFLKATTASHLRMMKRKVLEGQKGWKMVPIEVDHLKEQIKSILAPTADEFDFETMKNNIKFN